MSENDVKDNGAQAAPDVSSFWKQQYDEASSGSSLVFHFFKAERTRVRLIGLGNDPANWVRPVKSTFQDKERVQYLTLGFRIPDPSVDEEPQLQCIVFSKGAWASLCNMMIEGYDLFGPEGLGLTVNRNNANNRISYSLLPAPVKVPIPNEIMEAAKAKDWDFYLEEHRKMRSNSPASNQASSAGSSVADQIVNAPNAATEW